MNSHPQSRAIIIVARVFRFCFRRSWISCSLFYVHYASIVTFVLHSVERWSNIIQKEKKERAVLSDFTALLASMWGTPVWSTTVIVAFTFR